MSPKTILICGSRDATPAMLDTAKAAVWKVWYQRGPELELHHDLRIIVGDALGVDAEIVRACNQLGVPYQTVGINVRPRNGGRNYLRLLNLKGTWAQRYQQRDRYMVQQANAIFCISNGEFYRSNGTPSGTIATYQYAKGFADKQVFLWPKALATALVQ